MTRGLAFWTKALHQPNVYSTMAGGAPVELQVTTAEEVEGVVSKSSPSIREGAGVEHTSPVQPGRGLEEERDPTSPRNNPEASGNISSEDARPSRPIFRESKKAFQKPREPSPYGRKLFAENVDVDPRYPIGGHGQVELLVVRLAEGDGERGVASEGGEYWSWISQS